MNTDHITEDLLPTKYQWTNALFPERLKSPWWIGHIPFAFELVGRMQPQTTVELGTYSGSSFAAFCQAVEATGGNGHVYGVDLWQGDVHMGRFEEELYQEMVQFCADRYPTIATLIRKNFNEAVHSFADGSIDLLHIDGTHTFEAVSNDFHTWLPKMSDQGVVLFHDINVTVENVGPAAEKFGVRTFFDSIKSTYPSGEFDHCFGLGVVAVGANVCANVIELIKESHDPETRRFFAAKGALVSIHFESLGIAPPQHGSYGETENEAHESSAALAELSSTPEPSVEMTNVVALRPTLWRRAINKLRALAA